MPVLGRDPLRGRASWYDNGAGLYAAAGPQLRRWLGRNWRGSVVTVSTRSSSVRVQLTDWCQCYKGLRKERIIDLSPMAFGRLASLSRGTIRVSIGNRTVSLESLTPPPTDTLSPVNRLWSVPS